MAKKQSHKNYRRKEKTDYGKRLNLLKSGLPRLTVRISNKNIIAQIIEYSPEGDKVIYAVSSKSLEKLGWTISRKNISAAYLVGYALGKKAKGVKEAILDIGKARSVRGSRIYAVVKGMIDAGIKIPVSDEVIPDETRIKGEHIKKYAETLSKENKEKYEKLFSLYIKKGIKPETLPEYFNKIKSKI